MIVVLNIAKLDNYDFHASDAALNDAIKTAYRKHVEQGLDNMALLPLAAVELLEGEPDLHFVTDVSVSQQYRLVRDWCREIQFDDLDVYKTVRDGWMKFDVMVRNAVRWRQRTDGVIPDEESPALVEWMLHRRPA